MYMKLMIEKQSKPNYIILVTTLVPVSIDDSEHSVMHAIHQHRT